jgi:hypothetical protein
MMRIVLFPLLSIIILYIYVRLLACYVAGQGPIN